MKIFFTLLQLWIYEKQLTYRMKKGEVLLRYGEAHGFEKLPVHIKSIQVNQRSKMMLSQVRRVLVDYGWRKEV